MTREEIDVTVENFVLIVKGEKKLPPTSRKSSFTTSSGTTALFSRSFQLPRTVDAGKVSADTRMVC